jgi:hypothetical protein
MARQDHSPVTDEQRQDFLDGLAEGKSIVDAAGDEGLRCKLYRLKRSDPEFAEQWQYAYVDGNDALAAAARKRAVDGVPRHTYDKDGNLIREEIVYSDTLLMFLMKQRDASFKDRVAIEGAGCDAPPVQVEVKHSVDDLAAVASILAGAGALRADGGADS